MVLRRLGIFACCAALCWDISAGEGPRFRAYAEAFFMKKASAWYCREQERAVRERAWRCFTYLGRGGLDRSKTKRSRRFGRRRCPSQETGREPARVGCPGTSVGDQRRRARSEAWLWATRSRHTAAALHEFIPLSARQMGHGRCQGCLRQGVQYKPWKGRGLRSSERHGGGAEQRAR